VSVGASALTTRAPARLGDRALGALAVLAAVPAGCALGLALYRFPPPLAVTMAGGVGLVAVLALALARFHGAVALAFVLLGVVVVDPAPADGVFCVVMAVAVTAGGFRMRTVPRAVVAILAAYAALNLMSAMQVADPGRAALFFAITLYLALLALWLPDYLVSVERARLVVRAYLLAAVASAAAGVLALLGLLPGASLLTESDRARALFQDPNVFGPFLVPAALILTEEIVRPRLLRARTVTKALLLIVVLLGVLFSYSRGAWLNLAIAFVVMTGAVALRGSARHALALVGVAVAAGLLVGAAVQVTGSADFLAERARPQTYDTQRFSGQRAGLQPAQEYPLGAGPGQFESVADISAHSTYARTLGEQGFPGLLVLLALFGFTLGVGVRNVARGRDTYGIGAAALLAAWCGLLANSAFIDTLHWRHLWIVAALVWAGAMVGRVGPTPSP
jgi:O-antigen ligase